MAPVSKSKRGLVRMTVTTNICNRSWASRFSFRNGMMVLYGVDNSRFRKMINMPHVKTKVSPPLQIVSFEHKAKPCCTTHPRVPRMFPNCMQRTTRPLRRMTKSEKSQGIGLSPSKAQQHKAQLERHNILGIQMTITSSTSDTS